MPKDPSIRSVLVIGSGPIVIGQACEFDYSGTQAIKVLRKEGIRASLVNSNPATIMTDPEYADRTHIQPLTPDILELILMRNPPVAELPTVAGQIDLNLAVDLSRRSQLDCPLHPHQARFLTLDIAAGPRPTFVMELNRGAAVDLLNPSRWLSVERAFRRLQDVLAALEIVRGGGLGHLGIKPQNIISL